MIQEDRNTLEYQLGWYVGDRIADRNLPTLYADGYKGRNAIQIPINESDHLHKLEKSWFDNGGGAGDRWDALQSYRKDLIETHLPHELECFVPHINYTEDFNMPAFKEGIRGALWDSDICQYKIESDEDIVIDNDEKWFTKITLKLDI